MLQWDQMTAWYEYVQLRAIISLQIVIWIIDLDIRYLLERLDKYIAIKTLPYKWVRLKYNETVIIQFELYLMVLKDWIVC